jgi:uncharacterized membrane protein
LLSCQHNQAAKEKEKEEAKAAKEKEKEAKAKAKEEEKKAKEEAKVRHKTSAVLGCGLLMVIGLRRLQVLLCAVAANC